ncbi:hypothetical protein D9M68_699680 [compost metagenome]
MNYIFKAQIISIILCFYMQDAYSQKEVKNDLPCNLVIDTIQIQEAIITNSVMSAVIDSALSLIKYEPVNGRNIPYFLKLYPENNEFKQELIALYAGNVFLYGLQDQTKIPKQYAGKYCIDHKGYKILIDTSYVKQAWLKKYIAISKNKIPYYIYTFYSGKFRCGVPSKIVNQDIHFHIWPEKRKPFSFEQYTLTNYDDTYIYDNEKL